MTKVEVAEKGAGVSRPWQSDQCTRLHPGHVLPQQAEPLPFSVEQSEFRHFPLFVPLRQVRQLAIASPAKLNPSANRSAAERTFTFLFIKMVI
jgi:hypothetical protein